MDLLPGNLTGMECLIYLSLGLLAYFLLTPMKNYWDTQPVAKKLKRKSVLGTLVEICSPRKPFIEMEIENYKTYGKLYGSYEGGKPLLVISEPELIKQILVKDFYAFPNRRPILIGDPSFDKSVLALQDEDWKRVRTIVTPTFSSSKMRKMADLVKECAESTVQNFLQMAEAEKVVDIKTYFGTFTMDAIASCAFGIKIESHRSSENPFVKNAMQIFSGSAPVWKAVTFFTFPRIAKLLGFKLIKQDVIDFFKLAVKQIIKERKLGAEDRNDFLQLLLECQKTNQEHEATSTDNDSSEGHEESSKLSEEELTGQCLVFFLAGYDTTASALTFAAYNLALYPECQERLIQEIDEMFAQKGDLTYDDIGELSYLDAVISETLRLYPSVMRTTRTAAEDYCLRDTGIIIPKGSQISVPIAAMHRDPEFFPDPERFNPLRFLSPSKLSLKPYSYLPFGAGPRNCIGMRFALMESKICLAYLMRHIRFRRCEETKVPPEFVSSMGLLRVKAIKLRVEKRYDTQRPKF